MSTAKTPRDVIEQRGGLIEEDPLTTAVIDGTTEIPEEAQRVLESDGTLIDLTKMGSLAVYATVSQIVADPFAYEGRTMVMEGDFNTYFSSGMDRRYFTVVVQDATACCAQGIEFVWGDGSMVWPDDYPESGTRVQVTGTVEAYQAHDFDYMRLVDATLTLA